MAPVVYLPGFSDDKPYNMDIQKGSGRQGTRSTEAASDRAKDTLISSPSPHHATAVKTPMVLWPETPEPSDADFCCFFPVQGPQEAMIPTMGQSVEVPYCADATMGLPLQLLHHEIQDANFHVDISSSEGDDYAYGHTVDAVNFSFSGADYEENCRSEQSFEHEFAPVTTDMIPAAEPLAMENTLDAASEKEFMHQSGQCRPCAWFWKKEGCKNGDSCGYCHLCPAGELKARKKTKVLLLRSGALDPKKGSAQPGAGRQLRLDPLVGCKDC